MANKKLGAVVAIATLMFVGLLSTNSFSAETSTSDVVIPNGSPSMGFIKFDGVDGEATEENHKKWCDLIGFEQGQSVPGKSTGSSRRRGDVIFDDITVVKELDKASPKIAESVCKSKVYPKVEIELTASYVSGRAVYYRYELTNAKVTSYTVGSDDVSQMYPEEILLINFEEIKVTYTERDESGTSKGNVEYTWKVEEGES